MGFRLQKRQKKKENGERHVNKRQVNSTETRENSREKERERETKCLPFQLTFHQTSTLLHPGKGKRGETRTNIRTYRNFLLRNRLPPPLLFLFFPIKFMLILNKGCRNAKKNGFLFVSVLRNGKEDGERRAMTTKSFASTFHACCFAVLLLNGVPHGENQGQRTKKRTGPTFFLRLTKTCGG